MFATSENYIHSAFANQIWVRFFVKAWNHQSPFGQQQFVTNISFHCWSKTFFQNLHAYLRTGQALFYARGATTCARHAVHSWFLWFWKKCMNQWVHEKTHVFAQWKTFSVQGLPLASFRSWSFWVLQWVMVIAVIDASLSCEHFTKHRKWKKHPGCITWFRTWYQKNLHHIHSWEKFAQKQWHHECNHTPTWSAVLRWVWHCLLTNPGGSLRIASAVSRTYWSIGRFGVLVGQMFKIGHLFSFPLSHTHW